MSFSSSAENLSSSTTNHGDKPSLFSPKFTELLSTLPKQKKESQEDLYQYQGFWYPSFILEQVVAAQQLFEALSTDIIIAGGPKTGNTWLKALCFAIATRKQYQDVLGTQNPLLTKLPHTLVPFLEFDLQKILTTRNSTTDQYPLISTHLPYTSLPESIISSDCKIIYICREPKDTFVSRWHFYNRFKDMHELRLDNEFNLFCQGKTSFGPYWDHVLGYHKASLDRPDKFLLLKYEELKKDTTMFYVKKLATFMNMPFSTKEELEGVPEKIVHLCSFQNLSGLRVNKDEKFLLQAHLEVDNSAFFRKGSTGDWKGHMTMEMVKRIDSITEEKLQGSGFSFYQEI